MEKVLVIEDDEDNMILMTFLLEKNGFSTVRAENGKKGIESALIERPDFILLDIQLPDMDGLNVLKEVRSSEGDRQIPIIAVTSFAMSGDMEKLLGAGCNGYIEKPIDPDTIISRIKEIIRDKKNCITRLRKEDEDPDS